MKSWRKLCLHLVSFLNLLYSSYWSSVRRLGVNFFSGGDSVMLGKILVVVALVLCFGMAAWAQSAKEPETLPGYRSCPKLVYSCGIGNVKITDEVHTCTAEGQTTIVTRSLIGRFLFSIEMERVYGNESEAVSHLFHDGKWITFEDPEENPVQFAEVLMAILQKHIIREKVGELLFNCVSTVIEKNPEAIIRSLKRQHQIRTRQRT